ncbi:MAG: hypothetical protein Q6364_12770 [Candidatus Hermodarchaeota archaeon]|nr:hypothetical protein [Candidatus Hermodarchaeota archaeon]
MGEETEFDQFLDFIGHFAYELTSGTSPEYALVRTVAYFGDQTSDIITEATNEIIKGTKSFENAWADFDQKFNDAKYSRLVMLLGHFLEKGSQVAGERMLQVVKQVRKNNAMTKERKNLISGQRGKVLALSLVSSIVMGMITALAPMLSLAFIGGVFSNPSYSSSVTFSWPILIALFLTVIITGYRLNQTVEGSMRIVFLHILAFSCTYILTNQLLSAFL